MCNCVVCEAVFCSRYSSKTNVSLRIKARLERVLMIYWIVDAYRVANLIILCDRYLIVCQSKSYCVKLTIRITCQAKTWEISHWCPNHKSIRVGEELRFWEKFSKPSLGYEGTSSCVGRAFRMNPTGKTSSVDLTRLFHSRLFQVRSSKSHQTSLRPCEIIKYRYFPVRIDCDRFTLHWLPLIMWKSTVTLCIIISSHRWQIKMQKRDRNFTEDN